MMKWCDSCEDDISCPLYRAGIYKKEYDTSMLFELRDIMETLQEPD